MPGLSSDGAIAIWIYTADSPLYEQLNDALRRSAREYLKRYFFPFLRLLLEALAAVKRSEGTEKRMLNRGVPLNLVQLHPDDYEEDATIVWWQFSSCTLKIRVLSNPLFLGASGPRTIFQILTSRGVDIRRFSAMQEEASEAERCSCRRGAP